MLRRVRIVLLALAVAAGLPAVAPARPSAADAPAKGKGKAGASAPATRQAQITDQLEDLHDDLDEATDDERALKRSLDDVEDRRDELDERMAKLVTQVASVEKEAEVAQARLDEVQATYVAAQTRLSEQNELLSVEKEKLRRQAVAAYVSNPVSGAAELFLRAGSLREVAATTSYLNTVSDVQQEAVRRYTARRDATDALRLSVEERKDAARLQRDEVVRRLSNLEGLRAEQQALVEQVADEEVLQNRLLSEVQYRKLAFETEISALAVESSTIGMLLQGLLPPGAVAANIVAGTLRHPVAGFPVTSRFGPRTHPIFGTVRMHDGVDYGAPLGTPIRASAAGTVVAAGPRGGYGEATIINHGNGVATLYGHQSVIAVAPGTVVAAGQVIGAVGSTGFSTGPHLHFEVRVNGQPVDPLGGLPAAAARAA